MRVLVTGAAGFIGSRVCALAAEGVEPIALVRPGQQPPSGLPSGSEVVEADLASPDFARGGSLPDRLGAVVHLAQSSAQGGGADAQGETHAVAVGATTQLLEHARAVGASRFLLASTATVNARSPGPLAEDAALDLSSDYAQAKRSAELVLADHSEDISSLALRIFTPYGPGQRDRLIARLIERVRGGEQVQVEGERGLLLSPTHVDDIALAINATLALPAAGPGFELLNLAADEALGIREIAERIGEAVGRATEIDELGGPEPGGLTADCSKLRATLPGFDPRSFAEGIRQSV